MAAAAEMVIDDLDMELESVNESQIMAPPAHIAARIYKKNVVDRQRKSSAASSRRSSISSRHSHQALRSPRGGSQSNLVAQHLRRASIIESRKARLAERAAHAEQVRLRAALAKASPRGTLREERAVAAQAAREKLLAEIAARCEEEVRRAKQIAEENKERKAAELAKLREETAQKHAEAAKRRLEYQLSCRRPRTSSLPRVEEKKIVKADLKQMSKVAAAKMIQRQWRAYNTLRVIKGYEALGLSVASIKRMEFEDVGGMLSTEQVLVATSRILGLFDLLTSSDGGMSDRGSVRVFLSAYLIHGHPDGALSYAGTDIQEQELLSKAEELLVAFEKATHATASTGKLSSHEHLPFLFHTFTSAFHSWKSRDSTSLIDVMVKQFVELDLILQTVKDDKAGGAAEEYNAAIKMNQIQLLAKLKRFAGHDKALDLVRTAVRKARKQHAKARRAPSPNDVPRTAVDTDESSRIEHPDLPVADRRSGPSVSLEDQNAVWMQQLRQSMTQIPSNREVSHEILINGFYEVQQQPWTESRKAFTDSIRVGMRQVLEQGGDLAATGWIRSVAILIRERLMNLISERHPLYERIDNFLDIRLIDQSCRAGLFSYDSFFENLSKMLAQLCSPGRDEVVKAFAENRNGDDNIGRLFNLVDILDLMSLDHINYAFRMAAPTVLEYGLEHETANSEADLSAGRHTLEKAKETWRRSRSALLEDGRSRDPSVAVPSGQAIYVRGLTDLVLSNRSSISESIPETLQLDHSRLQSLRAVSYKIAATAAILLTTKIRLRRNREVTWTADADRIMSLDFADPKLDAQRIISIIESSHIMPDSTREGLLSFVERVLPPVAAAATSAVVALEHPETTSQEAHSTSSATAQAFTEPLALHLLRTLHSHVSSRLSATSTAERVRVTTSAAENLARAGMPEFVAEVSKIVDTLERVRRVDLAAHGRWYDEIATQFSDA